MVRNGYIQSSHGTLELLELLTVPNMEENGFFVCLYKLGKLKVDSMIFGWAWSKTAMVF